MSLVAIGRRVVVRPEPVAEKSPGGIHLPAQAKERPVRGVIVSSGPRAIENGLKVGQTVTYPPNRGYEVEEAGEKLIVLHFRDVVAIVS